MHKKFMKAISVPASLSEENLGIQKNEANFISVLSDTFKKCSVKLTNGLKCFHSMDGIEIKLLEVILLK